jgi:hypothetical protein
MDKLESWTITLCLLAVTLCIPSWVYRWALMCLVVVPLGVALVLIFI